MLKTLSKVFAVKELQNKILFTLLVILIYRVGSAIPLPYIDAEFVKAMVEKKGSILNYLNIISGGNLGRSTIFALSIGPYINSSIIVQLLTFAVPALEKLQKEGQFGRKKLLKLTRYLTVALAIVQGLGYYVLLRKSGAIAYRDGFEGIFSLVVMLVSFMAGTAFIVWLGERVSEKGIGNGISIILFAGIVSRAPKIYESLEEIFLLGARGDFKYFIVLLFVVGIFVTMIMAIVIMHLAERRIPIQYAKRIIGRKMYAGQSAHIPIKISLSGVMPIIFASCLLGIPVMIMQFVEPKEGTFWFGVLNVFNPNTWKYAIMYFILIIVFNCFYVSVQYNPTEIANNLIKSNGAIPGIRPGRPTSQFISKVLWKVATVGAFVLGIIAVFPIVFSKIVGGVGSEISLGGTSIIILVGVALETVRVIKSQITVQNHRGFLE